MIRFSQDIRDCIIAFDRAVDDDRGAIVQRMHECEVAPTVETLRGVPQEHELYHACRDLAEYIDGHTQPENVSGDVPECSVTESDDVQTPPLPTEVSPNARDDNDDDVMHIDDEDILEDEPIARIAHTEPYVPMMDEHPTNPAQVENESSHSDRAAIIRVGVHEVSCVVRQIVVFRIERHAMRPDQPVIQRVQVGFSCSDVMLLPTHDQQNEGCIRSFEEPAILDFNDEGAVEFSVSLARVPDVDVFFGIEMTCEMVPEDAEAFRLDIVGLSTGGPLCVQLLSEWLDKPLLRGDVFSDDPPNALDTDMSPPAQPSSVQAVSIPEQPSPQIVQRPTVRWGNALMYFGLFIFVCFITLAIYKGYGNVETKRVALQGSSLSVHDGDALSANEEVHEDVGFKAEIDAPSDNSGSEESDPFIHIMRRLEALESQAVSGVDLDRLKVGLTEQLQDHASTVSDDVREMHTHVYGLTSDRLVVFEERLAALEYAIFGVEVDLEDLAERVFRKIYGIGLRPTSIEDPPDHDPREDYRRVSSSGTGTSEYTPQPRGAALRVEDIQDLPKFAGYSRERLEAYVARHNSAFGLR